MERQSQKTKAQLVDNHENGSSQYKKANFVYLDMLRGISALTVMLFHLRILFFYRQSDMDDIQWTVYSKSLSPAAKCFYFLTSFGHEAVILFFVLSGFLITRSIYSSYRKKKWSVLYYAAGRLSRLWTVLVPSLFLTCIWDVAGSRFFPFALSYKGKLSHFTDSVPLHSISVKNFFENAFFLRGDFGSNGLLWSLPCEFWYYVAFPMLFFTCCKQYTKSVRVVLLIVSVFLLFFLRDSNILNYFPVWLIGFFAMLTSNNRNCIYFLSRSWTLLLIFTLIGGLLVEIRIDGRLHSSNTVGILCDYVLGVLMALAILSVMNRTGSNIVQKIAYYLSSISFTLYLVHMPAAVFICAWLAQIKRPMTAGNALLFTGLSLLIIGYATLSWFCFERNTGMIRRMMIRMSESEH